MLAPCPRPAVRRNPASGGWEVARRSESGTRKAVRQSRRVGQRGGGGRNALSPLGARPVVRLSTSTVVNRTSDPGACGRRAVRTSAGHRRTGQTGGGGAGSRIRSIGPAPQSTEVRQAEVGSGGAVGARSSELGVRCSAAMPFPRVLFAVQPRSARCTTFLATWTASLTTSSWSATSTWPSCIRTWPSQMVVWTARPLAA